MEDWEKFYQEMDNSLQDEDAKDLILKIIRESKIKDFKELKFFLDLKKSLGEASPKVVDEALQYVKLLRVISEKKNRDNN
ncbi:MAG: hypothetical protein AABW52_03580 [Nanoarchaeota archaeon]